MELYPELKLKQCHLNDQAKMILCIDCAATSLNIGINIDEASKLSGLNKMKYTKQKDMYENHLGLRKKLTLHGICAQLELSEAIKKGADQLLKEYKKSHECVEDVNENPQYLAMAIYQSCRIRKFKQSSVKQSLIQVSRLNTKMWKELEEQWTKWMNGLPSVKSVGKENVQTAEQGNTIVFSFCCKWKITEPLNKYFHIFSYLQMLIEMLVKIMFKLKTKSKVMTNGET